MASLILIDLIRWDEWGTYANSMTELAGGGINPMNM